MKGKNRLLNLVVVLMMAFVFNSNNVHAQEKIGLAISPLTFELTANPGDTLTNKLKIYNPTDNAVVVTMEVEDFRAIGEAGQVVVSKEEENTYSLRKWIITQPKEFTIESKKEKFVDFVIEVPINAEPGGKYGSILASMSVFSSNGKDSTGAKVAPKVGALVLLSIAGEVKEDIIIKDFTTPSFLEYGPIPFTIKFENKGSVHSKPKGFVTITDWRGNKVKDLEFPQNNVMPGSVRKIETSWNTKWLFGKFTATIVGIYGASNVSLDPYTITFWVLPWRLMLGTSVVLLIVLTILFRSRKRLRMAAKILFKGEHHAVKKDS